MKFAVSFPRSILPLLRRYTVCWFGDAKIPHLTAIRGMAARSKIYIYSGYGCKEESSHMLTSALNKHVDPSHHDIETISPSDIIKGEWTKDAGVMVIGGGFDLGFIQSLGSAGIQRIRDYVWLEGGKYLGICAGAYFACDRIEFDKGGPLEVCGDRQLKFYPGACIGPAYPGFCYDSEEGTMAAPVDVTCHRPWADMLGTTSHVPMYINGGGYFTEPQHTVNGSQINGGQPKNLNVNSNASSAGISNGVHNETKNGDVKTEIFGRFAGLSDSPPALIKCHVGSAGGKAFLSSVHFEYDPGMLVVGQKSLKESIVNDLSKSDRERKLILRAILNELGLKTI